MPQPRVNATPILIRVRLFCVGLVSEGTNVFSLRSVGEESRWWTFCKRCEQALQLRSCVPTQLVVTMRIPELFVHRLLLVRQNQFRKHLSLFTRLCSIHAVFLFLFFHFLFSTPPPNIAIVQMIPRDQEFDILPGSRHDQIELQNIASINKLPILQQYMKMRKSPTPSQLRSIFSKMLQHQTPHVSSGHTCAMVEKSEKNQNKNQLF